MSKMIFLIDYHPTPILTLSDIFKKERFCEVYVGVRSQQTINWEFLMEFPVGKNSTETLWRTYHVKILEIEWYGFIWNIIFEHQFRFWEIHFCFVAEATRLQWSNEVLKGSSTDEHEEGNRIVFSEVLFVNFYVERDWSFP